MSIQSPDIEFASEPCSPALSFERKALHPFPSCKDMAKLDVSWDKTHIIAMEFDNWEQEKLQLTIHLGQAQNLRFGFVFVWEVKSLISPFLHLHLGATSAVEEQERDMLGQKSF